MPKEKKKTSTLWDPDKKEWRIKVNVRPYNIDSPIEIVGFIDEKTGLSIDIRKDIQKVRDNLLSKDVYKEATRLKDTTAAVTFTKGHHPSGFGYWSSQIIGGLTALAGIATNTILYLRLVEPAPIAKYNQSEEEYDAYQQALRDYTAQVNQYALISLCTVLVTTISIWGVYTINQYRVQHGKDITEQRDLIADLVARLDVIPDEINIKEAARANIKEFLKKDNKNINFESNFNITNKDYSSDSKKHGFLFWRHEKNFIGKPTSFENCILVVLDRIDDLAVYQGINNMLNNFDGENLVIPVLNIMKFELKKQYKDSDDEENTKAYAQLKINEIKTIYNLLFAVNNLSQDTNKNKQSEIGEFLIKALVKALSNTNKLIAIEQLLDIFNQANKNQSNKEIIEDYSKVFEKLVEIIDKKYNESDEGLNKIISNLNKLIIDEEEKMKNKQGKEEKKKQKEKGKGKEEEEEDQGKKKEKGNFIVKFRTLLVNEEQNIESIWEIFTKILNNDLLFNQFLKANDYEEFSEKQKNKSNVFRLQN